MIYVNVDSINLGFSYFDFFRGVLVKKKNLYILFFHIKANGVLKNEHCFFALK